MIIFFAMPAPPKIFQHFFEKSAAEKIAFHLINLEGLVKPHKDFQDIGFILEKEKIEEELDNIRQIVESKQNIDFFKTIQIASKKITLLELILRSAAYDRIIKIVLPPLREAVRKNQYLKINIIEYGLNNGKNGENLILKFITDNPTAQQILDENIPDNTIEQQTLDKNSERSINPFYNIIDKEKNIEEIRILKAGLEPENYFYLLFYKQINPLLAANSVESFVRYYKELSEDEPNLLIGNDEAIDFKFLKKLPLEKQMLLSGFINTQNLWFIGYCGDLLQKNAREICKKLHPIFEEALNDEIPRNIIYSILMDPNLDDKILSLQVFGLAIKKGTRLGGAALRSSLRKIGLNKDRAISYELPLKNRVEFALAYTDRLSDYIISSDWPDNTFDPLSPEQIKQLFGMIGIQDFYHIVKELNNRGVYNLLPKLNRKQIIELLTHQIHDPNHPINRAFRSDTELFMEYLRYFSNDPRTLEILRDNWTNEGISLASMEKRKKRKN